MLIRIALVSGLFVSALGWAGAAVADPVADFYAGKSLKFIVGTTVGGSYDTAGRLMARHLARHIPGTPSMVVQNIVGASGRRAANYVYNVAPRDGTVLLAAQETLGMAQILGTGGVEYDIRKFGWLGTPIDPVGVTIAWHSSGVKTLQEARKKEVVIGAAGPTGNTFFLPALANAFAGTKFKIIVGYSGGNAIDLAMQRGEVGGRGSVSWSFVKSQKSDWLKEKKVFPLAQMTLKKHPELSDVPRFIDLATDEKGRKVMEVMSLSSSFGRPIVTTPDVPPVRLAALTAAFERTVKDESFLAEAKKLTFDIRPTSGKELQDYAERLASTPPDIVALMKDAFSRRSATVPCEKVSDARNCRKKRRGKRKGKKDKGK